ncbi:uncharacterized protein LOC128563439 [Nycticebus coucang]|uniref:uncharacterized protein LOC128563439 n=1 Tax=Nycticebus coucang TaxID=9470 RepID=UPI00234D85C7|nr:uncharacterized protein LOC128563439 [Nycticebus coucang]
MDAAPRAPQAGFGSARSLTAAADTLEFPEWERSREHLPPGVTGAGGGATGEGPPFLAGRGPEPGSARAGRHLLSAALPFPRPAPAPWLRTPRPLPPPGLGFPLARGFLPARWSSAEPRGPQRAQLGPNPGDARGGGGSAGIGSPPQVRLCVDSSVPPRTQTASCKLARITESTWAARGSLGSATGRRRQARTERTRRCPEEPVSGARWREGADPPAGNRAEPPTSSKGAGLERTESTAHIASERPCQMIDLEIKLKMMKDYKHEKPEMVIAYQAGTSHSP